MPRKADALILFVAIAGSLAALPNQASAVLAYPDNVVLTIERGASVVYPINLYEIRDPTVITARGDAAGWIKFGGNSTEFAIDNVLLYIQGLPILLTISVPENQALNEYEADLMDSRGTILTTFRIKVTLELADVKAFEMMSDMDKEVGTLKDKVEDLTDTVTTTRTQMTSLEDEVQEKMREIYQYQKNLSDLEAENLAVKAENAAFSVEVASLRSRSASLEDSNTELTKTTGMMTSVELPGMLMLGLILGALMVTLVLEREAIGKKARSWSATRKTRKQRYSFRGL